MEDLLNKETMARRFGKLSSYSKQQETLILRDSLSGNPVLEKEMRMWLCHLLLIPQKVLKV